MTAADDLLFYSHSKIWSRLERKLWLSALFCICALAYATRSAMPLCVVEISEQYAWNKTETGIVLSAFFWGYTMTQILGGYLSDRFGAELVMLIAGFGWSAMTFLTPLIVNSTLNWSRDQVLRIFIALRMLTGIIQGFHFPSINSLLSRRIGSTERAFSLSFVTSGSHFGTLSIGLFGSVLLERLGWAYPFYIIGLIGLLWVCIMWPLLLSEDENVSTKSATSSSKIEPVRSVPWCLLFRKKPFWAIVVSQFCSSWIFYLLFSWMPTYFAETFPEASGWIFNAVPWLISIPCQCISGWWADHLISSKGYSTIFVRKLIQTLSFCGAGLSLLLMSLIGSSFNGALFCVSSAVAFCAFHHSGSVVNVQDIAPTYAGSVFGLINTAGAIPGFVGVYVAGYLLQVSGSWEIVFSSTAAVCFFGAFVFLTFASGDRII